MKGNILLFILSLLTIPLSAQSLYPDSAVVIGYTHDWAATGEASGNRVSVRDSQGHIHAVYCYAVGGPYADSADIYYVYSTDNGLTWSNPENVSQTESLSSCEPDLAIDRQNHLHCVWKQYVNDTMTPYLDYDLFYSHNDGSGWTPAVNISNQSYGANACYSSMVVDSRDYVHVVWDMDIGFMANWDIFYSFYNDTVWSAPYQISNSPYDDAFPTLAIDHSDNLHAVWRQRLITVRPIMYSVYDGISWTTPVSINDTIGGDFSCIVIDSGDRPHVMWSNPDGVYYSLFDGYAWSQPYKISDNDSEVGYVSMAIDSADNLYVVWSEKTAISDYDIYYRSYNGIVWSGTMNITQDSAFSYCPKLGNPVKGNKVDLIWVSQGYTDIAVVYLCLGLTSITEQLLDKIEDQMILCVTPNPFSQTLSLKFQIPSTKSQTNPNAQTALEIYDCSGRAVKSFNLASDILPLASTISWKGDDDSGRELPAGIYFIKLAGGDCSVTKKIIKVK